MEWPNIVQALSSSGALVATIFGFTYVVHQIRLVRRSLAVQANTGLSDQSLTILAFIAEHPDTYDYFYRSKLLAPNDPNEVEVLCVCEMIANYCDMTMAMLPDLPPAVAERWRRFITDTVSSSPVLRDHLNNRPWYSDDLLALCRSGVSIG